MIIEANWEEYTIYEHRLSFLGNVATFPILHWDFIGYTATHGRVSATAPTMHEAIALCACGVGQVKNVK